MRSGTPARLLIRLAARLVPSGRRREWREEWEAELDALERARREGGEDRLPTPLGFAVGALPHALWTRKEEWTMGSVWMDVRYAARSFMRTPGFTAMAVLTLALGIGANGAVFSVVNGLLFRAPDQVREPDRLVQLARSYEEDPRWDNWSWPAFRLLAGESRTLSQVAGYQDETLVLGRGPEARRIQGQTVTGSYFRLLGVRPHAGRLLLPEDDVAPGEHPVIVLSHGLWTRRWGADPSVVGSTVLVGGSPYQVVGVAPPGFTGVETLGTPPEAWIPAMQHPGYYGDLPFPHWGWSWLNVVGRLAPGATFAQAAAEAALLSDRLRQADPVNEGMVVRMALGAGMDPDDRRDARRASLLLLGLVTVVLLLACSNVANLFLARSEARRKEMGVRVALGAGRGRVGRQLLTESLTLAALATLLAMAAVRAGGAFLPHLVPYALSASVAPDGRVWLFTAAVGLLAGLLFGLVPIWALGRDDLTPALRQGRARSPEGGTRLRDGLVVLQLGISLALVTGAALLGRSLHNAREARPGFEPAGMAVAFADLESTGRYDEEAGRDLLFRLSEAARAAPGVVAAAVADQAPIAGGHSRATVRPADRPGHEGFEAERILVGPGYFETLEIPLLEGRALGGREEAAEPVVVVNQALARMFWPDQPAVGKRLAGDPEVRVVGVVGDVQMRSLRQRPTPAVYHPLARRYRGQLALHARGRDTPGELQGTLRSVIASVDPDLPVAATVSLPSALTASLGETRTVGYLTGVFGLLALTLAALGLYGLVSFGVSQRVRELGVRKALGARPGALERMVVIRGMTLGLLGLAAGTGMAWLVGRALARLLYGVAPLDPTTLAAAALILLSTALLAAWVPARRASRVDAAVSLRE